jgi:uridine kinase
VRGNDRAVLSNAARAEGRCPPAAGTAAGDRAVGCRTLGSLPPDGAARLAGPSSSGKTTSANRIATQLRADGLDPVMLSLDDYYIDRDRIPRDTNGEMDLEHINTLDIPRFNGDLALLLDGCEAEIPLFNFKTGKREKQGKVLKLHRDQPLIIEGIHALNPLMLGSCDPNSVFRIYVSALTTLNLDDHNRIRTTDLRLLRRLVRDYETRNASMEHTLGMWAKHAGFSLIRKTPTGY